MHEETSDRPLWGAVRRGFWRRCPRCGEGKLFDGYLRVRSFCLSCGEVLSHHRADDGPAYLTILIVGKIIMAVSLGLFLALHPPPWVMIAICWALALLTALWLLPRLKGAIVGFQWASRMHGFGEDVSQRGKAR